MSRLDMSGSWTGEYAYPGETERTTPFIARIEDRDGVLSGAIIEPNLMGPTGGHLEAVIQGHRQGVSVDFTKIYDGASDAAHAVDYAGRLSDDGNSMAGVWSLADLDGSFEMFRDDKSGQLEAAEQAVAVPQP